MSQKKILLTSVFGPFGVDDEWGRKENKMELFHNQITKAQGIASLRFFHRSYGLYFIAANIDAPVTVLDFPSRERFIEELKREPYEAIGISFIAPNYLKAKEMARLIREFQPQAEIILGGHGAAIEGVEKLIPCDHVAKGEGIRWFRRYLGEEESRAIQHPSLPVTEYREIFGIPLPSKWQTAGALLVPGVGCVNGCRFCCTSHFFGKSYTSFFSRGEDLYREIVRISDELGTTDFQIMDENFLKDRERALELMEQVVKGGTPYSFSIFSSAEAIEAFGIENMVRLGVNYVWIGAEGKRDAYEKNQGRDVGLIIKRMRDHGINVVASGILFSEHHTPESIGEDIDYLIGLEGTFTQFMMLTAMPVTALYEKYKEEGRLRRDLPYEDWHGQDKLNFVHPHFTQEEARKLLDQAFQLEYDRLSSSMVRIAETTLRGYRTLRKLESNDPWFGHRRRQLAHFAELLRILFPTMKHHAHNALERERVLALEKEYRREWGPVDLKNRFLAAGALVLSSAYALRVRLFGDDKQPKTIVTRYPALRTAIQPLQTKLTSTPLMVEPSERDCTSPGKRKKNQAMPS